MSTVFWEGLGRVVRRWERVSDVDWARTSIAFMARVVVVVVWAWGGGWERGSIIASEVVEGVDTMEVVGEAGT